MRELLEPVARSGLCEKALHVLRSAQMTRPPVKGYLQEAMRAFDRAAEVYQTPAPYGFKLHPHVRPYFAEGTQELIREGYHREAAFWIWVCHWLSNVALQNDATEEEKPQFQAGFDRLLSGLGLSTPQDWACRVEQARALADEVFQAADDIVAQNPEIVE
jgi:hypothetical protein